MPHYQLFSSWPARGLACLVQRASHPTSAVSGARRTLYLPVKSTPNRAGTTLHHIFVHWVAMDHACPLLLLATCMRPAAAMRVPASLAAAPLLQLQLQPAAAVV